MRDVIITVVVVSYNAEKTIKETLESIKEQTYKNIELIVSDDCSSDKTVELANKWMNDNRTRFVRSKLLTVDHNTGTTSNLNRALRECSGIWLKDIAADDILLPNCIESCMNKVNSNPEISWIMGKSLKFRDIIDEKHLINEDDYFSDEKLNDVQGEIEVQKKAIVKYNFIDAPSVFIKIQIIRESGGYDERYKLLEDWPMWKKLLYNGYKCYFLNEYIVGYRANANSVSNNTTKMFNIDYQASVFSFEKNELFKYNSFSYIVNKRLHHSLCIIFEKLNLNNRRYFNRKSYNFLYKLIDLIFK